MAPVGQESEGALATPMISQSESCESRDPRAIQRRGATPYIAFKSIHTGRAEGLWQRMYHFYHFNRDEFLRHCHKRSNVESTFSMIKAKFRDHVRSKTDVAMVKEVLCKIICHNICCLIQESHELGISAAFWADGAKETVL